MKSTIDQEKEIRDYLLAAGIQLSDREIEVLKKCSGYAERLIDRGASAWPVGLPLICKPAVKAAAKITFDDIAATVWKNRRNSPKKGERDVKKIA